VDGDGGLVVPFVVGLGAGVLVVLAEDGAPGGLPEEGAEGAPVAVLVVELTGLLGSPLASISCSICCCTADTCAATATGVPWAPSCDSAPSFFRSFWSSVSSCVEGCDLSVTTIWSAIAVVIQAGQSPFSAPAALMGVMMRLSPTTRTTWKDTATVVQLWQLARA
jgi:hypothetical protein